MSMLNTSVEYGSVAKFLHWLIALLVVGMLILGFLLGVFKSDALNDFLYMIHKSIGLTVLALIFIRLTWRVFNVRPSLATLPLWEQRSAVTSHIVLYILLIVMPLSGWIMSVSAGYAPMYFNLFPVSLPLQKNKQIADAAKEIHNFMAWVLIIFISIHLLAALKHYFWNKDQVFQRMLPHRKHQPRIEIE